MVGNFGDETLPLGRDEHNARRPRSSTVTVTLTRIAMFGIALFVSLTFYGLYFPQSRYSPEQSAFGMF